ncbi:MAG: Sapep family Mn(2+)-dependent dipeptidase [Fimbriimonadaceae bacterium]|jgi:succinyl-diaminopimelate desuccinylase|nr:Sapep family Mn(2+)-dependent dipeptidase [Fimbriimonadaceae bacterium]
MKDPVVVAVQEWLDEHQDEMVETLRTLLRIPSLEEDPLPNSPFGQANRDALDYMLGLAEQKGMTIKDLDGYIGYAEFGQGKGMVMSLGHLDVVPVGPGWKHEPFGAELEDGYIYSRGASDDKGPTVAMFFASLAVKERFPHLAVRIRNVFGCNEESGFKCIAHYVEREEIPTLGVAPDAGWPCVHGEKGIADYIVHRPLPKGEMSLVSIQGGQRPNIVIDQCQAVVEASGAALDLLRTKASEAWDKNLTFGWEGNRLTIKASGKAAHGSYPYGGDNAAIKILRFLKEAAPVSQEQEYEDLYDVAHIAGNGLGIAGSDEPSGPLTLNLGIISSDGNEVSLLVNIRYPVTWDDGELAQKASAHLAGLAGGYRLETTKDSHPLYFPLDHPLVKTITEVYEAETGDDRKPRTMGGGTYARAIPNTVAIGCAWPGDGPAHETDERISVDGLLKTAKIYGHLLIRLSREAEKLTAGS